MENIDFVMYSSLPSDTEEEDGAGPSDTNYTDGSESQSELTTRFLRGEISFSDYTNEWHSTNDNDDDEYENSFQEQMQQMNVKSRHNKVKRRPRKAMHLSPALLGLMGEANLRFARGEMDVAEKICNEIIRQIPSAPEPYQTLANIYEGDVEKSLQFSLIAAHLSPGDPDEWIRLAALSKERNDIKQEMFCYTQAIKADPQNLANHLKRIDLLQSLEEKQYPLSSVGITLTYQKCYERIVRAMTAFEGETIMKYARLAIDIYHKNNEMEKVLEVMNTAYQKCATLFTVEQLNLYLELLITHKHYQNCIEALVANAGLEIEAEVQQIITDDCSEKIEEQTVYLSCNIPKDLPVDLKSKLLVCFIHLRAINLVVPLIEDFMQNDIDKTGDLYMDVEEALTAVGEHKLALTVLEPLVKSNNFSLGAVWLKYADCLANLKREDDAIKAYKVVIELAPQHADARRKLFNLYMKQGFVDSALEILKQDYKLVVNANLLFEHCRELRKHERYAELLEVGEALLSKHFMKYKHPDELKLSRLVRGATEAIRKFRAERGDNIYNDDDIQFDDEESFKLSSEDEWELYQEMYSIALKLKKHVTMQKLAFGALASKNIVAKRREIDFYCVQSCILRRDYVFAFQIMREYVWKNIEHPKFWNLFNLLSNTGGDDANWKFITRIVKKNRNAVKDMNLFLGNNCLLSGRYQVALRYYLEHHEKNKSPLTSLLIAISLLVLGCQRTVDKHQNLILQGVSYLLDYQKTRKCEQECNYNLGRAYHMLGLNNLAISYYEKVLASKTPICEDHSFVDLKREAAFNLCQIYKESSPRLANTYLQKYIVI